jgi:hypothetical protein
MERSDHEAIARRCIPATGCNVTLPAPKDVDSLPMVADIN